MEKINVLMWDELVNIPLVDPEAELLGFLETLPLTFANQVVFVASPKLVVSRRLLKLWKGLNDRTFNATIDKSDGMLDLDRIHGKARFRLSRSVFNELLSQKTLLYNRSRWAWFRGIWGGCASLYLPHNGYYVSLRVRDRSGFDNRLLKTLQSVKIVPGSRTKQGFTEYMLRNQEQIVTCLSKMGLFKTSLKLEETAIVRSLRNKANKLVNCDSANINKTIDAARAQLELVDRLDAEGLWDELSPGLIELANARRENPSASFRELGQFLSKPISKSTVEYRWRKLEALIQGKHT